MVIYLTRSHPALNITFQLIFVVKIMGQASKQLSQFVSDDSCANNFAQKKTPLVGMVLTSKITKVIGLKPRLLAYLVKAIGFYDTRQCIR